MAFHIKFKDKASQKWFKSDDFDSHDDMMDHYWAHVRNVASDVEFHTPNGQQKADPKKVKEEATMSAKSLVEKIVAGEALEIETVFENLMRDKALEAVDTMRPAVYASMFGAEKPLSEQEIAAVLEGNAIPAHRMRLAARGASNAEAHREWDGNINPNSAKKPAPTNTAVSKPAVAPKKPVFGKRI